MAADGTQLKRKQGPVDGSVQDGDIFENDPKDISHLIKYLYAVLTGQSKTRVVRSTGGRDPIHELWTQLFKPRKENTVKSTTAAGGYKRRLNLLRDMVIFEATPLSWDTACKAFKFLLTAEIFDDDKLKVIADDLKVDLSDAEEKSEKVTKLFDYLKYCGFPNEESAAYKKATACGTAKTKRATTCSFGSASRLEDLHSDRCGKDEETSRMDLLAQTNSGADNMEIGPEVLDSGRQSAVSESMEIVDSGTRKSKPIRLIVAQVGRLESSNRERIEANLKDWFLLEDVTLGAMECESVVELEPFEDKPLKEATSGYVRPWNGADMVNAAFLPTLVSLLCDESKLTVMQKFYQALESMTKIWLEWKNCYEWTIERCGGKDLYPSREVHRSVERARKSKGRTGLDLSEQISFTDVDICDDPKIPDRSTFTKRPRFELVRFYISTTLQCQETYEKPLALVLALNDIRDIDELDKYLVAQKEKNAVEDAMSDRSKPLVLEVAYEGDNKFNQFTEKFHNDETTLEGLCEEATKHFRGSLRVSKLELFGVNGVEARSTHIEFVHQTFCSFLDDCIENTGIEDILSLQFWASGEKLESVSSLNVSDPGFPSPPPSEKQVEVACRILQKLEMVLRSRKEKSLSDFREVRYRILVPNYTTLRIQTLKRIRKDVESSAPDCTVFTYNLSEKNRANYSKFREEILENKDLLFVLIADESHWGPTPNGANDCFVNDAEQKYSLLCLHNFVVLQVSATPYCNLTEQSRIPPGNVIEWFSEKDPSKIENSMYVRLEHLLMTIPSKIRHDVAGVKAIGQPTQLDRPVSAQQIRMDYHVEKLLSSCRSNQKLEPEFILLVDYVFSMTFFSVFRWDAQEGRLRTSDHAKVSARDFVQFTTCSGTEIHAFQSKFSELCKERRIWNNAATDKAMSKKTEQTNGLQDLEDYQKRLLDVLIEKARDEIKSDQYTSQGAIIDDSVALAWIFYNKILCEEEIFTTSDQLGWFTETDRIVLDLLKSPERGWGHMKIVRVFDTSKGDFVRKTLKGCRDTLFKDGAVFAFQGEAHRRYPPFALIGDFSSTNLATIGSTQDVAFDSFPLMERGYRFDIEKSESRRCLKDLGNVDYCALEGLPCILVLCDKGRMGDTFPQNFDCLDLRIRASDNTTTLIQEIGRLCRYPKTKHVLKKPMFKVENEDQLNDTSCLDPKVIFEQNRLLAVFDAQDRFVGYSSHLEKWDRNSMVKILHRGVLRAEQFQNKSEIELQDLPGEFDWGEKLKGCRLGIRVDLPTKEKSIFGMSTDILSATKSCTGYIATISNPFSEEFRYGKSYPYFILFDGSSLKSLCSESGHKCKILDLQYELPYALIRSEIMKKLESAVDTSDETGQEISKCIQLKTLDVYMKRPAQYTGKKIVITKEVNPLHNYSAWTAIDSYDAGQRDPEHQKQDLRFLLFAECQIGKTGAYCSFLNQVRAKCGEHTPQSPDFLFPIIPPCDKNICTSSHAMQWALPYWKDISSRTQRWDLRIRAGKYHPRIRRQRLSCLLKAVYFDKSNDQTEWIDHYCNYIIEMEHLQCQRWLQDIDQLRSRARGFKCPLLISSGSICTIIDRSILQILIDWDLRGPAARYGDLNSVFWGGVKNKDSDPVAFEGFLEKAALQDQYVISSGFDLSNSSVQTVTWGPAAAGDHSKSMISLSTSDALAERRPADDIEMQSMAKSCRFAKGSDFDPHIFDFKTATTKVPAETLINTFPGTAFIRISVPKFRKNCFSYSPDRFILNAIPDGHVEGDERTRTLRSWVFTPTFNRHLKAERQALLDRRAAYTVTTKLGESEAVSAVQLLVVRPCCDDSMEATSEFDCYVRDYGSEYIVIEMPRQINLQAFVSSLQISEPAISDLTRNSVSTSEKGGIGYSRLFIQVFSFILDLHHIWMVDDNVQLCYALNLNVNDDNSEVTITSKPVPCSFATMMLSMEKCIGAQRDVSEADNDKSAEILLEKFIDSKLVLDFSSLPKSNFHKFPCISDGEGLMYHARNLKGCRFPKTGIDGSSIRVRKDFSGSIDSYALLGSGRDVTNYQQYVYDCPFAVTHSVYSFFLLNVFATVKSGAFYPPKPFWEDIEFNQICEEKGLAVVKARQFFHYKLNLQSSRCAPESPVGSQMLLRIFVSRNNKCEMFPVLFSGQECSRTFRCTKDDSVWLQIIGPMLEQNKVESHMDILEDIIFGAFIDWTDHDEFPTKFRGEKLQFDGLSEQRIPPQHPQIYFRILSQIDLQSTEVACQSQSEQDIVKATNDLIWYIQRNQIEAVQYIFDQVSSLDECAVDLENQLCDKLDQLLIKEGIHVIKAGPGTAKSDLMPCYYRKLALINWIHDEDYNFRFLTRKLMGNIRNVASGGGCSDCLHFIIHLGAVRSSKDLKDLQDHLSKELNSAFGLQSQLQIWSNAIVSDGELHIENSSYLFLKWSPCQGNGASSTGTC